MFLCWAKYQVAGCLEFSISFKLKLLIRLTSVSTQFKIIKLKLRVFRNS